MMSYFQRMYKGQNSVSLFHHSIMLSNSTMKRVMCIKGLIWPPLEPKTEKCFSQISFDWFIRRMTEM